MVPDKRFPALTPQTRILVVASNRQMGAIISAMARGLGIKKCREVHDAEPAMALLAAEPFDAIALDDAIAGGGAKFTATLRKATDLINHTIPVILLSGAAEKSQIEKARDAGVNEFVRLPASAEVLGMRLQTALSTPRAFVQGPAYIGPDRRRRTAEVAARRRAEDGAKA